MTPGLGRVHHYDVRNENFLLTPSRGIRSVASAVARTLGIQRARNWHQWLHFFQRNTPRCTAYGSATWLAADPLHATVDWLRHLDVDGWYADNVAEDRAHGRSFLDGATTLAAMEVGKRRGYWDKYEWSYNLDVIRNTVHDQQPVIFGTDWFQSMWTRNADGVVKMPGATEKPAGGHLYCINGYDPKRGLYRNPETWNDGDYWLPEELVKRLIGDGGECVLPHKLKIDPSLSITTE